MVTVGSRLRFRTAALVAVAATLALQGAAGARTVAGGADVSVPELVARTASVPGQTYASLRVTADATRPSTARIAIFAPAGGEVDLTRKVGDRVGSALVQVEGDTPLILGGSLVVDDPARYVADPAAQACAPGAHAAVWTFATRVLGQPIAFPVFVDTAP